jgi:hypothetical protein
MAATLISKKMILKIQTGMVDGKYKYKNASFLIDPTAAVDDIAQIASGLGPLYEGVLSDVFTVATHSLDF